MLRRSAPESAGVLQRFDQKLAEDLAEHLHQLRDVATPAPITLAELPPALRARYVQAG